MKIIRPLLVLPIVAAVALAGPARGDDRAELLNQHNEFAQKTIAAMNAGSFNSVDATLSGQKFRLVGPGPTPPPVPGCISVKIWGQLVDANGNLGPYVNLTKHKWQRKERFYLWLDTAVPIQLAFFQNFPEGRPKSKQISPDANFPSTYATIMPGAPYMFPIMIEMDDDLRDEQMGIVVVRADSAILPINGGSASASATATTIIDASTVAPGTQVSISNFASAGAQVNQSTQSAGASSVASGGLAGVTGPGGTLKSAAMKGTNQLFDDIYDAAQAPATKSRTKLRLVAGPPATAPASVSPVLNNIDEVCTVMAGPNNIAQIELTLFKD